MNNESPSRTARSDRWQVASALVGMLAGLLLVGSAFGPWTTKGTGATLAGHELADMVLRGELQPAVPVGIGLVFYVVPICGGIVLLSGRPGVGGGAGPDRFTLVIALFANLAVSIALAGHPFTTPGWGSLAVFAGLIVGAASVIGDRPPLTV